MQKVLDHGESLCWIMVNFGKSWCWILVDIGELWLLNLPSKQRSHSVVSERNFICMRKHSTKIYLITKYTPISIHSLDQPERNYENCLELRKLESIFIFISSIFFYFCKTIEKDVISLGD